MKDDRVQVHICHSPWGIGAYKFRNDDGTEDIGYGFYRPNNPHDFFPDQESCRPEEVEAHKEACRVWDEAHATAPEAARSDE